MKRVFFAVVVMFFISGCQTQGVLTHQELIEETKPNLTQNEILVWENALGTWYGNQLEHDGRRFEWVIVRDPYGIYKFTSRLHERDGTHDEVIEYGEWSISGPIYFVIPRATEQDGKVDKISYYGPDHGSAYKIITLTESEFIIRAYSDGSEFRVVKVEDNFTFSDAEAMHNEQR